MRGVKARLQRIINLDKKTNKEDMIINGMKDENFPAGIKPFRYPVELSELNDPHVPAMNGEEQLVIKIKQGVTIEGALRTVYHFSQEYNRKILAENWKRRLTREKEEKKKANVILEVLEAVKLATYKEQIALDVPKGPERNQAILAAAEKAYDKILEEIQESETRKSKEEEIQKMKKKQEKFNRGDPSKMIEETIKDYVNEALEDMVDQDEEAEGDAEMENFDLNDNEAEERRRTEASNKEKKDKEKKERKEKKEKERKKRLKGITESLKNGKAAYGGKDQGKGKGWLTKGKGFGFGGGKDWWRQKGKSKGKGKTYKGKGKGKEIPRWLWPSKGKGVSSWQDPMLAAKGKGYEKGKGKGKNTKGKWDSSWSLGKGTKGGSKSGKPKGKK